MEIIKDETTVVLEGALAKARRTAGNTIIKLEENKISPAIADAIYKQHLTIIDSFRVEIRGVELAHRISNERIDYRQALALIES